MLTALLQTLKLVGRDWTPPPQESHPALHLSGLGLWPFTYCCGVIKIADWQSMFAVL